ncbi:hypothetical protein GQ600_13224 [Phytophthora cactorum]|nr:hypothetical protein GQ600_13224 [Phytophthora cactorum]
MTITLQVAVFVKSIQFCRSQYNRRCDFPVLFLLGFGKWSYLIDILYDRFSGPHIVVAKPFHFHCGIPSLANKCGADTS